jgi:hypothetical protein
MKTIKVKVVAVESAKKGRWHFATPSVLNPGRLSLSLRTWGSKRAALRAGEREFRFVRI